MVIEEEPKVSIIALSSIISLDSKNPFSPTTTKLSIEVPNRSTSKSGSKGSTSN